LEIREFFVSDAEYDTEKSTNDFRVVLPMGLSWNQLK
jgi:hypothetical protein